MARALAWIGDGAPRMEVAHVERHDDGLTAVGTQLGAVYERRSATSISPRNGERPAKRGIRD